MKNKEGPEISSRKRTFHRIGGFLYHFVGLHLYEGMTEEEHVKLRRDAFGICTGIYRPGGSREKVLQELGILSSDTDSGNSEDRALKTIRKTCPSNSR